MASKLAAAKIAAWSGVRAVIAQASLPSVLEHVVTGANGVGTVVVPRRRRLGARKLWIAFAVASSGTVYVDRAPGGRCWSGACRCCRPA
jgi:glutamate 5-kinase